MKVRDGADKVMVVVEGIYSHDGSKSNAYYQIRKVGVDKWVIDSMAQTATGDYEVVVPGDEGFPYTTAEFAFINLMNYDYWK